MLSKDDADQLRADMRAKKIAEIARKQAIREKKAQQALKKVQTEAEKADRAMVRARAKDTRETNAEMGRMARIDPRLFT